MLRLTQFEGENFHQYFTRLHEYVDDLGSWGYQFSIRDMIMCIIDGMTVETRALAEHLSNGGLKRLGGLSGLWDFFCYIDYHAA